MNKSSFALCPRPFAPYPSAHAIHSCRRNGCRRVFCRRREFNRRRRHVADFSGADLVGPGSESRECDEYGRAVAGSVRRTVWISPRDERQLDDADAAGCDERHRGWAGRVALDRDAVPDIRAARAVPDLVRHDSVHAASADDPVAAYAFADDRLTKELVDDRDRSAVFLSNVRRIFRRREWHLDAGSNGPARPARHSSRERHQEFSRHLHQQCRGRGVFDYASGFMAASIADGGGRVARRILWRPYGAASRANIYSPLDCGDRIRNYDRDAVADEMIEPQRTQRKNEDWSQKDTKSTKGS